jgi:hypothetical protein
MSSSAVAARAWKVLDVQSNKRVVRVFKFYHEYRTRYQIEVKLAINETDYRIAFALPSAAQVYLSQTGPHKVDRKSVAVNLDDLETFRRVSTARTPLTPDRRSRRTSTLHSHALTPPVVRVPPPIPDEEEEGQPSPGEDLLACLNADAVEDNAGGASPSA